MKYFYTLAALVALVSAQQLPECAVSCIRDATASETTCTFGDAACTCQTANRDAVTAAATPCIISACGVEVAIGQVKPATDAICANLPASSAAAPPASSAAAPPASSAAAPPASSAAAPPASSAAAPSGDDSYPLPSAVPTSEDSYPVPSAAPSHAPSAAPSGNGTVTPPVEPPVEAGAAKAGFMGAAALVGFAALAL